MATWTLLNGHGGDQTFWDNVPADPNLTARAFNPGTQCLLDIYVYYVPGNEPCTIVTDDNYNGALYMKADGHVPLDEIVKDYGLRDSPLA